VANRDEAIVIAFAGGPGFRFGLWKWSIHAAFGVCRLRCCRCRSSETGVAISRKEYPECEGHLASAYDELSSRCGQFDVVVSLEVVQHVYNPRHFARTVSELLKPGGTAIISTPFHGYWKNLSLAMTGKLDQHFTVLWDHGHIKFLSPRTLTTLLDEVGLTDIQFAYAGRIYPFYKSMVAVARKQD